MAAISEGKTWEVIFSHLDCSDVEVWECEKSMLYWLKLMLWIGGMHKKNIGIDELVRSILGALAKSRNMQKPKSNSMAVQVVLLTYASIRNSNARHRFSMFIKSHDFALKDDLIITAFFGISDGFERFVPHKYRIKA